MADGQFSHWSTMALEVSELYVVMCCMAEGIGYVAARQSAARGSFPARGERPPQVIDGSRRAAAARIANLAMMTGCRLRQMVRARRDPRADHRNYLPACRLQACPDRQARTHRTERLVTSAFRDLQRAPGVYQALSVG
jgi:hypothetical protein